MMIGQWVSFQTDYGSFAEGEVIDYALATGMVTVRNDDEDIWTGPEDSVYPFGATMTKEKDARK